ncbi:acyl-CoA N-acyltransferase [Trichodelitschia bisporula]|uniref:Histone acetyltransferase type B catalytic subunit n=1 Tax=Trichodelitschia bisporula TaxID=703511 RepID=A0A6G1HXN4_9PEZI|nr:acyl-CoA N-acyltransferase [Trichodelitschia bisporula]
MSDHDMSDSEDGEGFNELPEANEWVHSANDVTFINQRRNVEEFVHERPFHPAFTYALFEEERIPGYKGLKIAINFRAHDMHPNVSVSYDEKDDMGSEEIRNMMNIDDRLLEYLPEYAMEPPQDDPKMNMDWRPPGVRLHTYRSDSETYEVWCASLSDPHANEIMRNMRILIPFYIEGGSAGLVDEDAAGLERWKVFFLYNVNRTSENAKCDWTMVGFATTYRLWSFPTSAILQQLRADNPSASIAYVEGKKNTTEEVEREIMTPIKGLDMPSRERISQFIILPPYQHKSHGKYLYNVVMSKLRSDVNTHEITIELPNIDFDNLRDMCDIAYLRKNFTLFRDLKLPDSLPDSAFKGRAKVPVKELTPIDDLEALRKKAKLQPRQFNRLVEMQLLSTIPAHHQDVNRLTRKHMSANVHDRHFYYWRLLLKTRLLIFNSDSLQAIEPEERIPKLEQTADSSHEHYKSLLETFELKVMPYLGELLKPDIGPFGESETAPSSRRLKVRRRIDDSEDEDDSGSDPKARGSSKRTRVA